MTPPGRHVLIVDDDPLYAGQLQRSLQRRGFDGTVVHDSASALVAAQARIPDAALLDLKLAEESGLNLIEPLRALSQDMVIVLLTGYASVATAVEAIKRGADDYLPKPASIRAIVRALHGEASDDESVGDAPATMTPLNRLEWEHIQQALAATGGNISAAARLLGMHRRSLQRKLGKRPVPERG
jgi:two-component system, response regulator RegA